MKFSLIAALILTFAASACDTGGAADTDIDEPFASGETPQTEVGPPTLTRIGVDASTLAGRDDLSRCSSRF